MTPRVLLWGLAAAAVAAAIGSFVIGDPVVGVLGLIGAALVGREAWRQP